MTCPMELFFWLFPNMSLCTSFAPNLRFSKLSPLEQLTLSGLSQKSLVSDICKLLNTYNMDSQNKHSYTLKWEQALGEELSTEQWQIIWPDQPKALLVLFIRKMHTKCNFFGTCPPLAYMLYTHQFRIVAGGVVETMALCFISIGKRSPPPTIQCRYSPPPKKITFRATPPQIT